jgi:hypothetical protein
MFSVCSYSVYVCMLSYNDKYVPAVEAGYGGVCASTDHAGNSQQRVSLCKNSKINWELVIFIFG